MLSSRVSSSSVLTKGCGKLLYNIYNNNKNKALVWIRQSSQLVTAVERLLSTTNIDTENVKPATNSRQILITKITSTSNFITTTAAAAAVASTAVRKYINYNQYRDYHSTVMTLHAVSRRRRRRQRTATTTASNEDDDDDNNTSDNVKAQKQNIERMDSNEFDKVTNAFLNKIHDALKPLLPINDNMIITRGYEDGDEDSEEEDDDQDENNEIESTSSSKLVRGEYILIDLGPVYGQYVIQVDVEQQIIIFKSPLSGQRPYILYEQEWCCIEDGHNLEGLLVRDLIKQIQGVPKL